MTLNNAFKIITPILWAAAIPVLVGSLLVAPLSLMTFDAPGSMANPMNWIGFLLVIAFPFLLGFALFKSFILYRQQLYRKSFLFTFIPVLPGLLFFANAYIGSYFTSIAIKEDMQKPFTWPVYTNSEYRFKVHYPPGSEVSDNNTGEGKSLTIIPKKEDGGVADEVLKIEVYNLQNSLQVDCNSVFKNYPASNIVLDGVSGKMASINSSEVRYCATKNNKLYLITFKYSTTLLELNQMFRTFRFIN